MAQYPHNVTSVVFACVTLHNIIQTYYRADHQGLTDEQHNDHREIPGAWRRGAVSADLGDKDRDNYATVAAKRQSFFETLLYNSVGAVPWQNMI